jgi:ankyrin repeat protein
LNRLAIFAVFILLVILMCYFTFRFIQKDDLNQAAKAGNIDRETKSRNAGGEVNGVGMHGMTPLMSACAGGHPAVVKYLIGQGADVDGHNDSDSALMWAIQSGNADTVKVLIEHNVDVSWKNSMGDDAMSFAPQKGDPKMIELLQPKTTSANTNQPQ